MLDIMINLIITFHAQARARRLFYGIGMHWHAIEQKEKQFDLNHHTWNCHVWIWSASDLIELRTYLFTLFTTMCEYTFCLVDDNKLGDLYTFLCNK